MALLRRDDAKGSLGVKEPEIAEADEQPAESSDEKSEVRLQRETGDLAWLSAYMEEGEASPGPEKAEQVNHTRGTAICSILHFHSSY